MARLARAATVLALGAISVSTIYPLVFMLLSALKSKREYLLNRYGLPHEPTLANFTNAWTYGDMGQYLANSAIVVCAGVLLSWVVCGLAAYALSHLRFPGRRAVFLAILGTMVIAPQVIIIPLYVTLIRCHLHDQHLGLILVYVTFATPFGTYLLTAYYRAVPAELVEAAQVDGAGHAQILWRIMVPIGRPAFLTLGIYNFLWMWNELLFALLISRRTPLGPSWSSRQPARSVHDQHIPLMSAGLFWRPAGAGRVLRLPVADPEGMTMGAVK